MFLPTIEQSGLAFGPIQGILPRPPCDSAMDALIDLIGHYGLLAVFIAVLLDQERSRLADRACIAAGC